MRKTAEATCPAWFRIAPRDSLVNRWVYSIHRISSIMEILALESVPITVASCAESSGNGATPSPRLASVRGQRQTTPPWARKRARSSGVVCVQCTAVRPSADPVASSTTVIGVPP